MSAFSAAVDAIFADPNMAADATYRPCNGGADIACRVVRTEPDVMTEFGGARIVSDTLRLDVRVAEVAAPVDGDRFLIGTDRLVIRGAPMRDSLGLVWRCEVLPEGKAYA